MAQVSGALSTYDVNPTTGGPGTGANREDLSNELNDISPTEMPFVSMAGTRKASGVQYDWLIDSLADPSYSSTYVVQEGNQTSRVQPDPPSRAYNVCQINERNATVTGTQEAQNTAGIESMMAYQKAKRLKEIKRDMELSALRLTDSTGAAVKGSDGTPLRRTRSFPHFIYTNTVLNGSWVQGTDPVTDIDDGTSGNYSVLTESMIVSAQELAYVQGGAPSKLIVSPGNKLIASGFLGRENSRQNIGKTEAVFNVTMYAGPFGVLEIVPDRYIADTFVIGVDPEYAQIAYLRRAGSFRLGKIGDVETDVVNVEWGVQCGNEKAHFGVFGLKLS